MLWRKRNSTLEILSLDREKMVKSFMWLIQDNLIVSKSLRKERLKNTLKLTNPENHSVSLLYFTMPPELRPSKRRLTAFSSP
jgi:hypothetical protein